MADIQYCGNMETHEAHNWDERVPEGTRHAMRYHHCRGILKEHLEALHTVLESMEAIPDPRIRVVEQGPDEGAFIVTGKLYLDSAYTRPLRLPAGPFPSRVAANTWVGTLGRLNGSYLIEELHSARENENMIAVTRSMMFPKAWTDRGPTS